MLLFWTPIKVFFRAVRLFAAPIPKCKNKIFILKNQSGVRFWKLPVEAQYWAFRCQMTSPSPPRPFVTNSSELLFGNSVSIRSAKSFPKPDSDFLGICSRWPWNSCTMQGAAHTLKRVAAKMCQEGTVPGAAPYLHLPRIFGFLKVTWMYSVATGIFNRWDYKRILWSLLVGLHEMTHIVDCKSLTMFTHHVFFVLGYMLDNGCND